MSEVRWRGQCGHVMTEKGQPQRTREVLVRAGGGAYHVLKIRGSRTVVTRDRLKRKRIVGMEGLGSKGI